MSNCQVHTGCSRNSGTVLVITKIFYEGAINYVSESKGYKFVKTSLSIEPGESFLYFRIFYCSSKDTPWLQEHFPENRLISWNLAFNWPAYSLDFDITPVISICGDFWSLECIRIPTHKHSKRSKLILGGKWQKFARHNKISCQ